MVTFILLKNLQSGQNFVGQHVSHPLNIAWGVGRLRAGGGTHRLAHWYFWQGSVDRVHTGPVAETTACGFPTIWLLSSKGSRRGKREEERQAGRQGGREKERAEEQRSRERKRGSRISSSIFKSLAAALLVRSSRWENLSHLATFKRKRNKLPLLLQGSGRACQGNNSLVILTHSFLYVTPIQEYRVRQK